MTRKDADIAEMQRLLKYASDSRIGEELGVKRQTVFDWRNGRNVSPKRIEQVRALIQESLGRKRIPPQSFDWDGVVKKLDAVVVAVDARVGESLDERLARLAAEDTKARQRRDDDGA